MNNNRCHNCNLPTNNPKFCSSKCNATYNNKIKPKKAYHCYKCGVFLQYGYKNAAKVCESCNANKINWNSVTLQKFKQNKKNIYQCHARLRSLARKNCKITPCINCGYDKHVEVCHIKPIKSFSDNDVIGQINDKSNLICLCPNCHWELDNGLIKLGNLVLP